MTKKEREEFFRRDEAEAAARDARARWNPWAEDRYFQTKWGKLKFALFGELKIFYWIFWGGVLLQVSAAGIIFWIGIHFIRKFW